jgi:3-hydroxyisobutyrate dehydrogenase-like beta-hydroxyacid dehydrogenase
MRVGLVGVGTMGSQICAALVKGGFEVIARDIKPEAEERARCLGAAVASSAAAVAREADVILLSLPWPQDVEDVVAGSDGVLASAQAGLVIADTSTVDPATTRRMAAMAVSKQVGYVDAPVLGRPQSCGRWTLPCGGTEEALEKVRPVLETLAQRIMPVGVVGSGNIVKLLNNLMFGAINAITAEVMGLCAKTGMEPGVFFEAVSGSGAATVSNLFLELGPKMLAHDWEVKFSVDLLYKDNLLGFLMGQEYGTPMPISQAVHLVNEMARAAGYGPLDTSAVVQLYEEMLNLSVQTQEP